jgi:hypothetical protein
MNDFGTPRKWARGLDVRRFFRKPSFLDRPIPVVYKGLGLVGLAGFIALLLYLMLNKSSCTVQNRQRATKRSTKSGIQRTTAPTTSLSDVGITSDMVLAFQRELFKARGDGACKPIGAPSTKIVRRHYRCVDTETGLSGDFDKCVFNNKPEGAKEIPAPDTECPSTYVWQATQWEIPTKSSDQAAYYTCSGQKCEPPPNQAPMTYSGDDE